MSEVLDCQWDQRSPPLILALTGGGIRGYFTALVLARIEKQTGLPCHKVFNLIAGTSIGGIIALGLAFGVPAQTIANTIDEFGLTIFPAYRFKKLRRLFGPPYSAEPIRNALLRLLPKNADDAIAKARQHVMVIAASLGTNKMEVLASWDRQRTAATSVIDAALATSAAPTYFPAHRIQLGSSDIDLIDGGIAANAPDSIAIFRGAADLQFPEERIALLSIGTCGRIEGGVSGVQPSRAGLIGAVLGLGGRGIVSLMMAVQEERGISEGAARLGQDRYLRIDRTPSNLQAKLLDLDNASLASRRTMEMLADAAYQDLLAKQGHNVWQLVAARAQASQSG